MRNVSTISKTKLAIVFILIWGQVLGGITASKTVVAESGNIDVACTWTLDLAGSYGDQISWELRDSNANVLLSGGGYSYGFSDTQTVEAAGPLTFYIETMGQWLDNVVNYHISNQNGIVVAGTLTGGAEITHDDLSCDDEPAATSEGCLVAFYSSNPTATYQPICAGINETITTGGYAGQYSSVQVTQGTEYTFSSSNETDLITIGDEAGETVLAYGTNAVIWTADSDRIIRFYTHTDAYCNYMNMFRLRFVKCGEAPSPPEEPDYDCFQGDGLSSNDFENAFSILAGDLVYRNVDDIVVAEGTKMTIQHIRLNIATQALPISNISFIILADDNGVPTNEVVATTESIVPTKQIVRGYNNIGFPVYEVSVDLTEPIELTEGRYWLLPQANVPIGSPYWEMTSLGSNGNYVYHSENGGPWIKDDRNYNAVFFVAGECGPIQGEACTWTLDLAGSYGDQISWELRDSNANVLLSGGGYSYGFSDTQTVEAAGPLTFYIETMGQWLDNVVNYHISNQNGIVVAGTLTGGAEITLDDLSCDDEPAATSEGCLVAFYGSNPAATYQPICAGINETITTGGYAGQYSSVQVTQGTEYTFSSSNETDLITIGDEAGETVLAYGTNAVIWTADSDRIIRFYTHTDAYCNYMNMFRLRFVKCGEAPSPPEEPDYDCFQGDGLASNDFENAFSILAGDPWYRNVDDIVVAEGTKMTIQHIRLNIATQALPISNISFIILADDNGMPTNEVVVTTEYIVPTNQIVRGYNNIGFPVYEVSVDLTEPIELTEGRYWLLPQANVPSGSPYWEMTSLGSNGEYVYTSYDGGNTWFMDDRNYNAVFFVAGECGPWTNTPDYHLSGLNHYPNPVGNVLNIETETFISQLFVNNIDGRNIIRQNNVIHNRVQLDVSLLTPGVYVVKLIDVNKQIRFFKFIKG